MLIADAETLAAPLRDTGATVVLLDASDIRMFGAEVAGLCVNGERVQVYSFATDEDRILVTGGIDRNDPSHVSWPTGDGDIRLTIVEWIGRPKFWGRDRVMVLYVGSTAIVEDLLTSVLGPPLVSGRGRDILGTISC